MPLRFSMIPNTSRNPLAAGISLYVSPYIMSENTASPFSETDSVPRVSSSLIMSSIGAMIYDTSTGLDESFGEKRFGTYFLFRLLPPATSCPPFPGLRDRRLVAGPEYLPQFIVHFYHRDLFVSEQPVQAFRPREFAVPLHPRPMSRLDILGKQLSAKAESFYLSSLQSNSTLGRFTTALGLSADSPIPAGSDLHSSRCAHGDHSADKQNDASSVCPIANTPNTSVRYTEDPHTLR